MFVSVYVRCVDVVKSSQYTELADDLEIIKAVTYLRQKDFNQVTEPIQKWIQHDIVLSNVAHMSKCSCFSFQFQPIIV